MINAREYAYWKLDFNREELDFFKFQNMQDIPPHFFYIHISSPPRIFTIINLEFLKLPYELTREFTLYFFVAESTKIILPSFIPVVENSRKSLVITDHFYTVRAVVYHRSFVTITIPKKKKKALIIICHRQKKCVVENFLNAFVINSHDSLPANVSWKRIYSFTSKNLFNVYILSLSLCALVFEGIINFRVKVCSSDTLKNHRSSVNLVYSGKCVQK